MKRRDFIAAVVGGAAWPQAARAQQAGPISRIGFLIVNDVDPNEHAFYDALRALGWIEGQNVVYERRSADNRPERLPELAAELVRLNVDVIAATGTLAPLAAKRATKTIPVVMLTAGDPLGTGLIASLGRPGGNVTGVSLMGSGLGGKRLQLLKDIVPRLSRVAVLWNEATPYSALVFKETQTAAQILNIDLRSLAVRTPDDLNNALEAVMQQDASALITVEDPLTVTLRHRIVDFAAKNRLPAIYGLRDFVDTGGLIAYGANIPALYTRAAGYVDKILKGANPADLPVEQPTKFELVINLKAAAALGITIPDSILARADEVIE